MHIVSFEEDMKYHAMPSWHWPSLPSWSSFPCNIGKKHTQPHRGVSLYGTCAQNCADSQTFLCCINILQRKLWNQYWIRKEHKHDTLQSMWIFWCALCLIIDPFTIDIISLINLNMILGGFYHWRRPQFGQLFPMLTWSTPAGWIQFSLSLFFTFTINNQLFPMLIWNTPAGWIRFSLSLFFTFPFS